MSRPTDALMDALRRANDGDFGGAMSVFADDAVMYVPGNGPLAGTHTGHDALVRLFAAQVERSGGTLQITAEDALVSDRHAVMFQRMSARRDGRDYDVRAAQFFKLGDDGKVAQTWFLPSDVAAFDALSA